METIKIPEGCEEITVNKEGNNVIIEFVKKDSKAFESYYDMISGDFYYSGNKSTYWIIQFKEYSKNNSSCSFSYYCMNIGERIFVTDGRCGTFDWQPATPEQKQELIDLVEKETGKKWNEETKTFEEVEWSPKEGEVIYLVNSTGYVEKKIYDPILLKNLQFIGNCFKTKNEAESKLKDFLAIFKK